MSELDKLVGNTIRTYRRARQITLEEMARLICKSKATVGKYEQGLIALDINTLCDIAEVLGVQPSQLMTDLKTPVTGHPNKKLVEQERRYLYQYNGKTNRILRSLLLRGKEEDGETPVSLFYNLPDFSDPGRCRALYTGRLETYGFMSNYILENQANHIEHVFLCLARPLDYSGREAGLISGISTHTMLPTSVKCLLSDQPLTEDDSLIEQLTLTKEDLRLTRKYNMFTLESNDI